MPQLGQFLIFYDNNDSYKVLIHILSFVLQVKQSLTYLWSRILQLCATKKK